MYRTGGHGLKRDSERASELFTLAAEAAMATMKGKLATEYCALAEEVLGEVD